MSLLSLDIATKSGFCLTSLETRQPLTGGIIDAKIRTKATATKAADHQGRRLNIFNDEISRIFRYAEAMDDPITHIVYERITTGLRAGGNTSAVARHLEAMVIRSSFLRNTQLQDVSNNTIKKWATGNGKSRNNKDEMMELACAKYPEFTDTMKRIKMWDDNLADALWVSDWAINNIDL